MLEHWVLPGAVVSALIVLFLVPAVEGFLTTSRVERRFCPHIRYEVEVEYLERGGLGITRPVDVLTCAIVGEPITVVLCARPCLERARASGWPPLLPRAA